MSDFIKLEYTEIKEERNAFLKEKYKKILKKRVISIIINFSVAIFIFAICC